MDVNEINVKGKKIILPKFYSKYAGNYFYYQMKNLNENYCFTFFKSKDKADKNLPVLFCHIDINGDMVMPVDLMRIYDKFKRMYFVQNGIDGFSITTCLDDATEDEQTGLTSIDDEFLSILF